jgi:hypothetical protein
MFCWVRFAEARYLHTWNVFVAKIVKTSPHALFDDAARWRAQAFPRLRTCGEPLQRTLQTVDRKRLNAEGSEHTIVMDDVTIPRPAQVKLRTRIGKEITGDALSWRQRRLPQRGRARSSNGLVARRDRAGADGRRHHPRDRVCLPPSRIWPGPWSAFRPTASSTASIKPHCFS